MKNRFFQAWKKTKKNLLTTLPLVSGMILIISLISSLLKPEYLTSFFHRNVLMDSLIGGVIGSLAAGTPITSYVLGGEFLKVGISLAAVTAFIISWVNVGLIQAPMEGSMLGKKFAFFRNLLGFGGAISIGLIVHLILA